MLKTESYILITMQDGRQSYRRVQWNLTPEEIRAAVEKQGAAMDDVREIVCIENGDVLYKMHQSFNEDVLVEWIGDLKINVKDIQIDQPVGLERIKYTTKFIEHGEGKNNGS